MKEEKIIEKKLIQHFSDIKLVEIYKDKIEYLEKNRDVVTLNVDEEIKKLQRKVIEIEFKNSNIDEIIADKLKKEELYFVNFRYKNKLSIVEVEDKMFMTERTFYRFRKRILEKLKILNDNGVLV